MQQLGKIMIIAGIVLVILGLLLWFGATKFSWFGHLPGDIRIRKENFSFYFPFTSMLLLSVLLSLIIWIIGKITRF
jgi:magnesium-transporting ATPase (P-type)